MLILTAILSFLSSCLPSIMRYFEERQRLKNNVQLETIRLEAAIRNLEAVKELEKHRYDIQDTANAREEDNKTQYKGFMEFLRASIRPVITYTLFGLFIAVKIITIYVLWNSGININNAEAFGKIVLDEATMTLLALILGFWFGSRVMSIIDRRR